MNHYGAQARKHWQTYLPNRYATISDPNSFFSTLGEQAAQQIANRQIELAGPDQPGEGYLDKLGRLNAAKQQAEEEILPELILIDPETDLLDSPNGTEASPSETSWTPLVEDPTDPRWQQIAQEEAEQNE
jgi:hypothetical protein